MRYLVTARVKMGQECRLLAAIESGQLGAGSIADGEYVRNMFSARLRDDGTIRWIEVCYCEMPLAEERCYWEEYFELLQIRDAPVRSRCRDETGTEPWACSACDCTERLEHYLSSHDEAFIDVLRDFASANVETDHPASCTPEPTLG